MDELDKKVVLTADDFSETLLPTSMFPKEKLLEINKNGGEKMTWWTDADNDEMVVQLKIGS